MSNPLTRPVPVRFSAEDIAAIQARADKLAELTGLPVRQADIIRLAVRDYLEACRAESARAARKTSGK